MKTRHYTLKTILAVTLLVVGVWIQAPPSVHADDTNFSDGITVDSTDDTSDANIGDNICDDGAGACTLRAAIQESNATAGAQAISFNITGAADFTNGGQNGYTIATSSNLPNITDTVIIDGYSQPGALPNSAAAPNPLNGRLLIELDGDSLTGNGIIIAANDVVVRGIVVNNFSGTAVQVGPGSVIQGTYIGTNPAGSTERAVGINNNAINSRVPGAVDVLIGGLDPEDRNLIAGNSGSGITPNTGDDNWTIQGNYIGVDVTGLEPLQISSDGGAGALSLDNSDGHIVGGNQPGAMNVIGSSLGHGIAPANSNNLLIEGNYIGLGYDGVTVLGNNITSGASGSGIVLSNSNGVVIRNNRVSGWKTSGVSVANGSTNVLLDGNVIGNNPAPANLQIAGLPDAVDNVTVQGNRIGTTVNGTIDSGFTQSAGLQIAGNIRDVLIGGTNSEEANTIAGNNGVGVNVSQLSVIGLGTLTPGGISILGNSIYSNNQGSLFGFSSIGLGIDLSSVTLDGFTPQSVTEVGITPNDSSDPDAGPNSYINFPVLSSAKQTGTSLALNYNLDAANSPSDEYRIEFFANETADPSGYGEGQTFLGAVMASIGNGNTATLTLPNGTDLTGKVISATTTAIDNTTDSGFGSTSEFSAVLGAEVISTQTTTSPASSTGSGSLAQTGQNTRVSLIIGVSIVTAAAATMIAKRKYVYKARP